MHFLGGPASPEQADASSQRLEAHWREYGFGLWAVRDSDTGALAGFAGLSHPLWWPARAGVVEVGWRLARHAWGKGFATRTGQAAIDEARMVGGVPEVHTFIHPDNARSLAVATRLGFTEYERAEHPIRAGEPILALSRGTARR